MTARPLLAIGVLAAVLPLGACATSSGDGPPGAVPDPYEGSNRAVFGFNEGLDRYMLDPLAEGWEFITFQGLRHSVDKFFVNLAFPRRLFANLGQARFKEAGSETGRFLLNTTVGLLGFFDPATHFGMDLYDEDFGQMFGAWGWDGDPYWVLPVFGPSNPRDTVGLVFDLVFDIRTIASATPAVTLAWTGVIQNVNRRALLDEDIEAAREAALDFYVFQRDAYVQRRRALVANEEAPDEFPRGDLVGDDLYEFKDDPAEGPSEDLYEIPDEDDAPGSGGPDAADEDLDGTPSTAETPEE